MSSWNDWAQDRRIREAEETISALQVSQARERRRLSDQLRKQSGDLQQQIDRLREAFLAFVELEDVRGELSQHADAAAARRYAREVVAAFAVGGQPYGVLEPVDVPGYWLPAAARVIVAASAGRTGDAERELAEARLRDPARTAFLVVLLEAVRQEPRWAPELLAQALPADAQVTRAQRLVWTAVADGRLGEPAREQLAAVLAPLVAHVDEDAVVAHLGSGGGGADALPVEVAAARLRRLVTLLDRREEASGEQSEDPLSDCLRDLVDEGAPHEAEILERMQAARARMGGLAAAPTATSWDEPVGEAAALLLGDLGSSAHPGRHDLAVRVLRPVLERVADRLHADAQVTAPTTSELALPSKPVTITLEGVDDGWRTAEHDHAYARQVVLPWRRPAAIGAAVVALLGFVLIAVSGGFVLLGIAGLVAAVALGYQDFLARKNRDDRAAASVRFAEGRVDQALTDLRDTHDRTVLATAAADQDHETIRARLGTAPAA